MKFVSEQLSKQIATQPNLLTGLNIPKVTNNVLVPKYFFYHKLLCTYVYILCVITCLYWVLYSERIETNPG